MYLCSEVVGVKQCCTNLTSNFENGVTLAPSTVIELNANKERAYWTQFGQKQFLYRKFATVTKAEKVEHISKIVDQGQKRKEAASFFRAARLKHISKLVESVEGR